MRGAEGGRQPAVATPPPRLNIHDIIHGTLYIRTQPVFLYKNIIVRTSQSQPTDLNQVYTTWVLGLEDHDLTDL